MQESVTHACQLCFKPIDSDLLDDPDAIYRKVTSWVHGPKLQSPVLREQTGDLAHRSCIEKLINGQSPDQESLPFFEEVEPGVWNPATGTYVEGDEN